MVELKPCLSCGGLAQTNCTPDAEQIHRLEFWVECTECELTGLQFDGLEKAIKWWNNQE